MSPEGTDLVAALERWESAQGRWQVLVDTGAEVTVGLFSCDGGTQVDRVTGPARAQLRQFLAGRTRSDD